ncbi:MAG: metallophosphoesterase [Chitinophagaceae bacterium]|nr:metallophosphoesterase [Chitinophagaceae bacterium]
MKRRDFIANTAAACITIGISTAFRTEASAGKKLKIGLIADLHQDLIHNGQERLEAFLEEMRNTKPDAIMQLGDFAYPGDKNKAVIDLFNNAHPTRLHVIGNHDTDAGYKKEQCISYWGMQGRYYVQQVNGISFIVLDGNDTGSPAYKSGYPSFICPEQVIWLKEQLNTIKDPIVIVSHQPLAGAAAVDNAEEIQEILGAASAKILVAINGHTHIDALLNIQGINYVHINSASYFWVGSQFKHDSYPADILASHPWITSTCPYKDPLFTTMTIDLKKGKITFKGKRSEWVGRSPEALGFTDELALKDNEEIVPFIRERGFISGVHQKA